jgi:hypothetical protein
MADDPFAIAARLAHVLDTLRVSYAVGGSLASSLHGVPRATNDIDVVADLRGAHVDRFVAALEGDFLVDAEMIRGAVAQRSSFNVFDQATMMKVDIFVASADEWVIEELLRARSEVIDVHGQPTAIRFATAEDTLLYKLVCYRLGGEQSDRQWSDVLGVIKVQAERLDRAYLRHWAKHLKVTDLLERALKIG